MKPSYRQPVAYPRTPGEIETNEEVAMTDHEEARCQACDGPMDGDDLGYGIHGSPSACLDVLKARLRESEGQRERLAVMVEQVRREVASDPDNRWCRNALALIGAVTEGGTT